MSTKYKYLQFKSGVEVIAIIEAANTAFPATVKMWNPLQIGMGKDGIQLAPWLPWAADKDGIQVRTEEVVIATDIKEEYADFYEQSFARFAGEAQLEREQAKAKRIEALGKIADEIYDKFNVEDFVEDVDALSELAEAFGPGKVNTAATATSSDSADEASYDKDRRALSEIMEDMAVAAKGKKN